MGKSIISFCDTREALQAPNMKSWSLERKWLYIILKRGGREAVVGMTKAQC